LLASALPNVGLDVSAATVEAALSCPELSAGSAGPLISYSSVPSLSFPEPDSASSSESELPCASRFSLLRLRRPEPVPSSAFRTAKSSDFSSRSAWEMVRPVPSVAEEPRLMEEGSSAWDTLEGV
jgi:hypothetical protein